MMRVKRARKSRLPKIYVRKIRRPKKTSDLHQKKTKEISAAEKKIARKNTKKVFHRYGWSVRLMGEVQKAIEGVSPV